MPLLPNLADIKGFASSFNPLNAFSSPESTTTTPTPTSPSTPTPASHTASAVAGPGPSTLSIGTRSSSLAPAFQASSHLGPTRPSISMDNSSVDSLEGLPGRRKSSTSVMIASPEVIGRGERSLAGTSRVGKNVKADGTAASASSGVGTAERRRRRVPLDTYIIVKPPPTSSKHPLNLQIQLVVKSGGTNRERSHSAMSFRSSTTSTPSASPTHSPVDLPNPAPGGGGAVVDLSSNSDDTRSDSPNEDDGGGSGLQRAVSLKSSVSQRSASVSTLASNDTAGSFGGGTRKRVEPMFNLAVHNVMHPTTVTDAATDFKVAKVSLSLAF
ncbi:hypothetical protein BCR39DRAFT_289452 [Naematelia encephala]|uniref:Uncharacterized protein n=1 Tax=Naematelia encephala TaxID=71784 RepID=A0A1Y2ASQ6_9TREE|nr:hypothetical protein BCR39DRAFT_289452 [Naematelia encephala]